MKSIFIILFAAACCSKAIAQSASGIPGKVVTAFSQAYKGASKAKWDTEEDMYEVSFLYAGNKMSVLYTKDGSVAETETAIAVEALPPQARTIAAAKGHIKEAARIVKADGSIQYEAEVKGKDLLFDEKGTLLSEKKD